MDKPVILLGMINDAGIAKIVAEALTYHGFEVIDYSLDSLTFEYPNLVSRLSTQWKKLQGNKQAKKELMVQLKQQEIQEQLSKHSSFDYALFIRSDVYPDSFLKEIKQKSSLFINYQWDAVSRFPAALKQIDLFDRFYVFDPNDLSHFPNKLYPATSFYFDHIPPTLSDSMSGDIYFLGAHREDRKEQIIRFCQDAEQVGWKLNFQISYPNHPEAPKEYPVNNIRFHKGISYRQNIINAQNCQVLADFVISSHKGLSLRTFEAIGYQKKLITTNSEVLKYDFYHSNNIYVWDGENLDGIDQFLAKPYISLTSEIIEKYSFGNWIKYILQIPSHIPIFLPCLDK